MFRTALWLSFAFFISIASLADAAEKGLANCASQFPGGSVANAPTYKGTDPATPRAGNVDLCNRSGKTSFFALEYDPKHLIPDWVAYKLSNMFGADRCGSYPRNYMQCYFKSDGPTFKKCLSDAGTKQDKANDPFHIDDYLKSAKIARLSSNPFSGTAHDRGHMAPNNAFSWHLCGTYQTFSMANMAPQIAWFNRNIWRLLEENVLYWGVEHGPIYVVTGPIYTEFPYDQFEVIKNGTIDKSEIVKPDAVLRKKEGTETKPKLTEPTGFFKVIYRPGSGSEPARAVAFLVPHTTQKYRHFESFISTVALVEKASGLRFGFPESLKRGKDNKVFLGWRTPKKWSVRGKCPGGFKPQALFLSLTVPERKKLCAGTSFDAPQ